MNNEYRSIYWFFPVIISVYLSLPIFAYVEDNKKKQVFSYILLVGFVINIFLPEINKSLGLGITIPFQVSVVSGYLMYVMIGYLLTHYKFQNKHLHRYYMFGYCFTGNTGNWNRRIKFT